MEDQQTLPSSDRTMMLIDSNNNNTMHYHHSNRRLLKRRTKQQQFESLSSTDRNLFEQHGTSMSNKRPLSWTKRWSKWFSACSAERESTFSEKTIRTKSENDVYLRAEKIEKFNRTSKTIEDSHHHYQQSVERVRQSNRDRSRRYSNPYISSLNTDYSIGREIFIPISSSKHQSLTRPKARREYRFEEEDGEEFLLDHHARDRLKSIESIRPYSRTMAERTSERDEDLTYGRLSECHSPLIPLENSAVKAPRRIESSTGYSQFPSTTPQEPLYANTQSLYDNILYPTGRPSQASAEKKSCASQTQLTWTMATFSSFVDLENQSIIIPQPDPSTLHSIQRLSPSIEPSSINPSRSSRVLMIEKRDGSFQTLLTVAPGQEINVQGSFPTESTPSPLSTGSSSLTDQRHHHSHSHRHRRHRSRTQNASRQNINTRDVALQVNIQMVKKIAFLTDKSDESSFTLTSPSQATVIPIKEMKHVQTNTETTEPIKFDRSTSYENLLLHQVDSASQTTDSNLQSMRQTKSSQTSMRSLRDQAIETNNLGLFVCDLSSLLKSNLEDLPTTTTTLTIKRKT